MESAPPAILNRWFLFGSEIVCLVAGETVDVWVTDGKGFDAVVGGHLFKRFGRCCVRCSLEVCHTTGNRSFLYFHDAVRFLYGLLFVDL